MKKRRIDSNKLLGGLVLSPLLFAVTPVYAGGFELSDHSISALGRSQAGYGLLADDASAAFFNPAAMSLLSRKQWQAGASFVQADAKFTNLGSTGVLSGDDNNGAEDTVTPSVYFVLPIGERWRFGLALNSPFATNTDYSEGFVGAADGLITRIETVNINPSFSYKISEGVSFGFGLNYQEFDTLLSSRINPQLPNSELRIDGSSESFGYNLGVMFSFADQSRLGLSYRSKVDHEIHGGNATFSGLSAALNGSFPATADFTVPETIYAAYTKPLGKAWDLALSYRWTRWSRFQELNIFYPTAIASQSGTITTRWNDSETISIGFDYKPSNKWTLRAGFALDQTPVPDETRSVRTVDADRTWYSLGASYYTNKHWQFDFAYRYIKLDNAPVNRSVDRSTGSLGQLVGEFNDVELHTIGLQMNYKY